MLVYFALVDRPPLFISAAHHQFAQTLTVLKKIGWAQTLDGFRYFTEALDCYDLYRRTGQAQQIEAVRTKALEANKAEQGYIAIFDLLYCLSVDFYNMQDYRKAEEMLSLATSLNPKGVSNYATTFRDLGIVLQQLGDIERAHAEYQRAIDIDPNDANSHSSLGYYYRDVGDYGRAISEYQTAIKLDPKYVQPHIGLAGVYRRQGNIEEAIRAYQQAIKLNPKSSIAHASLAACFLKLNRQPEYSEQVRIASELRKEVVAEGSLYNQACFEALIGNTDEALKLLEEALATKQQTPDFARRDIDFDSLRGDARFKKLVGE